MSKETQELVGMLEISIRKNEIDAALIQTKQILASDPLLPRRERIHLLFSALQYQCYPVYQLFFNHFKDKDDYNVFLYREPYKDRRSILWFLTDSQCIDDFTALLIYLTGKLTREEFQQWLLYVDASGKNFLHQCIIKGDHDCLKKLSTIISLQQLQELALATDEDGNTPLSLAYRHLSQRARWYSASKEPSPSRINIIAEFILIFDDLKLPLKHFVLPPNIQMHIFSLIQQDKPRAPNDLPAKILNAYMQYLEFEASEKTAKICTPVFLRKLDREV